MPDTDQITAEPAAFAGTPPTLPAPQPGQGRPPTTQVLPGVRAKLAELAGSGASFAFDDDTTDALAPARGIATAAMLAAPIWAMVGAGLWAMLK